MSLDLVKLSAFLDTLPAEDRSGGTLQVVDLAAPIEPNPIAASVLVGLRGTSAASLALAVRGLRPDQRVWLLSSESPPAVTTVARLGEDSAGAEMAFVPAVDPDTAERSLAGFRHIVHRLHAPGGCPWDRKQTHQSLAKYTLEEAYEVVDAIEHGGSDDLAEELGDVLLQVFLHSEIAGEAGRFTLNDVIAKISEKLIRRHPHVFGDVQVSGAADVEANWEVLKKAEKSERISVLDGIPRSLPALVMAAELQKRMRKTGFEWPDRTGAEAKLAEELEELRTASSPPEAAAELGDVLFVLTGLAAWHDATAEDALRRTNAKVEARFRYLEQRVRERGQAISDLPLVELLAIWNEAKTLDPRPS